MDGTWVPVLLRPNCQRSAASSRPAQPQHPFRAAENNDRDPRLRGSSCHTSGTPVTLMPLLRWKVRVAILSAALFGALFWLFLDVLELVQNSPAH